MANNEDSQDDTTPLVQGENISIVLSTLDSPIQQESSIDFTDPPPAKVERKYLCGKLTKSQIAYLVQLALIQLYGFTDAINQTQLYSYAGYMIEDFDLVKDRSAVGYYAGFLASSYFLAQTITSPLWGKLSDVIGRRPVALFGMLGTAFFNLAFGFSPNFWFAVACRFLCGFCNANMLITKAMLNEISTADNQAWNFSLYGMAWGVGCIVGPVIGGLLSQAHLNYEWLFPATAIHTKPVSMFPYLLPNLFIFITVMIVFVAALLFLEETHKSNRFSKFLATLKKRRKPMVAKVTQLNLYGGTNITSERWNEMQTETCDNIELILHNNAPALTETSAVSVSKTPKKKIAWWKCRDPWITILLYSNVGFIYGLYFEILPLWALIPEDNGGIAFSSTKIGILFMCMGITEIISGITLVPLLVQKFGCLSAFKLGLIIIVPGVIMNAEAQLLRNSPVILWISCILLVSIIQFGLDFAFASVLLMLNNSVSLEDSGMANGVAQAFGAIFKVFAPPIGSIAFAVSVSGKYKMFLIERHFIWGVFLAVDGILFITALFGRKALNHPKAIE